MWRQAHYPTAKIQTREEAGCQSHTALRSPCLQQQGKGKEQAWSNIPSCKTATHWTTLFEMRRLLSSTVYFSEIFLQLSGYFLNQFDQYRTVLSRCSQSLTANPQKHLIATSSNLLHSGPWDTSYNECANFHKLQPTAHLLKPRLSIRLWNIFQRAHSLFLQMIL